MESLAQSHFYFLFLSPIRKYDFYVVEKKKIIIIAFVITWTVVRNTMIYHHCSVIRSERKPGGRVVRRRLSPGIS